MNSLINQPHKAKAHNMNDSDTYSTILNIGDNMKTLPQTLSEATELLQRMINEPATTQEIHAMFKGCFIQYDCGTPMPANLVEFKGFSDRYTVTDLPEDKVSVITEEPTPAPPKRMYQDDHKAIYDREDNLGFLVNEIYRAKESIEAFGDNTLYVTNGEGSKVRLDAPEYYRPMFIEDKQQEILAIVARMRDLLTDIAKENGAF